MLHVVDEKGLEVAQQILVLILVSTPVIVLSSSIYILEADFKSGVDKKEPKIRTIFLRLFLQTPKLSNSQLHRLGIGPIVTSSFRTQCSRKLRRGRKLRRVFDPESATSPYKSDEMARRSIIKGYHNSFNFFTSFIYGSASHAATHWLLSSVVLSATGKSVKK